MVNIIQQISTQSNSGSSPVDVASDTARIDTLCAGAASRIVPVDTFICPQRLLQCAQQTVVNGVLCCIRCCTVEYTHRGVGCRVWSKAFEAERSEVADTVYMMDSVAWYR